MRTTFENLRNRRFCRSIESYLGTPKFSPGKLSLYLNQEEREQYEKLIILQFPMIVPPMISPQPSTPPNSVEEISCKLPKLVISPFDGNTLNWTTFWDQFESSIHSKRGISDMDKFSYLRSFLAPVALETISGLTLSSQNYSEAIDLLNNLYGTRRHL